MNPAGRLACPDLGQMTKIEEHPITHQITQTQLFTPCIEKLCNFWYEDEANAIRFCLKKQYIMVRLGLIKPLKG